MRCDASRRRSGGSERGRPCESLDAGVDGGGGTIRRVAGIAVDTTQKSADRLANAPLSRAWRNEQRASCISTPFTEMSMMPERRGPNGADPDGAAPERRGPNGADPDGAGPEPRTTRTAQRPQGATAQNPNGAVRVLRTCALRDMRRLGSRRSGLRRPGPAQFCPRRSGAAPFRFSSSANRALHARAV